MNSIFVSFGWIVNIYPNMHIAMTLVEGSEYYSKDKITTKNRLTISTLTATFAVLYDLYLDPIAVHLGIWIWSNPGPWFGVPIGNFVGWWLITFSSVYSYIFLSYGQRQYRMEIWIPLLVVLDILFILLWLGIFHLIIVAG